MEEVKEVNIVSFSGGKDSTAMLLMMLERGLQVDEVIFLDTGVEFPAMYDHIRQVEEYTGINITKLKNPKDFEYFLYEHKKTRGKYIGEPGFGYPHMINRWCTANLKTRIYDKYLKEKYEGYKINSFVGIAYDEREREREKIYPLIEWKVTEKEALQYCLDKGFTWNGLYEKFNRVSCWCCPMQRIGGLRTLYKEFPDLWEKLVTWQNKLDSLKHGNNKFWCGKTIHELEARFKKELEDGEQMKWEL